jgi:hypothetical protein
MHSLAESGGLRQSGLKIPRIGISAYSAVRGPTIYLQSTVLAQILLYLRALKFIRSLMHYKKAFQSNSFQFTSKETPWKH